MSQPDNPLLRSHLAPPERTLIDVLTATAAEYPDAAAIDDGGANSADDGVLTYAELVEEIERRAADMRKMGVRDGGRVGVR